VDHVGQFVLAELSLLLAREIPFVSDNDQTLTLLDREAREPPVLRGYTDHRIEDEQRDVAARDRLERTQRRIVFNRTVCFGLLTHAGRVDQANRTVVPVQERVGRVARRARNLGDDCAFFTEQRIEQRTLANVRSGAR
jgi:hypothetical protein